MKKKSASHSAPARRNPWLGGFFGRRRLCEGGFFTLRLILSVLFCFARSHDIPASAAATTLGTVRPATDYPRTISWRHAGLKIDISPKSLRDIVPLPVKKNTKSENEGEGPIPPDR
jgi:hypothetical protein